MKNLFAFVLGLLFFLYPLAVQAKDEEPVSEPTSEDALNYLLSEDMYQGTLSWQGNKASTKFNYDKIEKR
tara:strand:+ start:2983 stop:3192 length:210 start_codon:yes stop_codon:yes gene_type:complete